MNKFFCAEACRQADEDIIGSGTNYSTYILIEYPMPWATDAFESSHIPNRLKCLVEEVKQAKLPIRFLLITQDQRQNLSQLKLIIYEQIQEEFSTGYDGWEIEVSSLEQATEATRQYIAGELPEQLIQSSQARDILVCTHGSHDKCCAKYGIPFYKQATLTVAELGIQNVRIWRSSHFGGHRFAPTMIDFPDGRYYGLLEDSSFRCILTQTGSTNCLNRVYRGWGILPIEIQVLERELLLFYGWKWLGYKVACQFIGSDADKAVIQVELAFSRCSSVVYSCKAQLVKDEHKTLTLIGSCNATKASEFVKYAIKDLRLKVLDSGLNSTPYPEQKAS
ncbi:MAG: sucrase ferredoxin [Microcoleaceae cyanobacterium]